MSILRSITLKNWVLIIVVVLLSTITFLFTSPSYFRTNQSELFNQNEWEEGDKSTRSSMADHIVTSDTLDGFTHDEVIKLLNKPDFEHQEIYRYELDYGHSMWPGESWIYYLNIHFDSTGHVISVGISD
ncbi:MULTISPECIES: hypothetical protein [Gracilimonas]|uniref:hypothetical protein n=1 Tax=Gracilimonas TaxID=649462 RepID=UPI0025C26835|nr:hypothetical protein [Gracilimonas sp.]